MRLVTICTNFCISCSHSRRFGNANFECDFVVSDFRPLSSGPSPSPCERCRTWSIAYRTGRRRHSKKSTPYHKMAIVFLLPAQASAQINVLSVLYAMLQSAPLSSETSPSPCERYRTWSIARHMPRLSISTRSWYIALSTARGRHSRCHTMLWCAHLYGGIFLCRVNN